jgi:hypothetical protein
MLEDGSYDAFVVDAVEEVADDRAQGADAPEGPALRLELTILSGPHKGEVVAMRTAGLGLGELDALGMPATLTVVDGRPLLVIDR